MELIDPSESSIKISDAHVWVNCPGSRYMQRQFPYIATDRQNTARNEGKAFHTLSQWMIAGGVDDLSPLIGTMSPHDVIFSEEIHDAASIYASDVLTTCRAAGHAGPTGLESRVKVVPLDVKAYGYSDAYLWDRDNGILTIWEGKGGHRFVSEYDNWQLILYSAGILHELGIDGVQDQHVRVVHKVVQPRCFTREGVIRSVSMFASDLRGPLNTAVQALHERDPVKGVPMCKSGVWCGDCSARYACDTFRKSTGAAFQYVETMSGTITDGHSLAVEMSLLQEASKLIESRLTALETQAERDILAGQSVPGFEVVPTKGRLSWNDDVTDDQIVTLGQIFNAELFNKPKPITPTQAVKKGVDEAVISAYAGHKSSGLKLAPIKGEKYRRVFNNLKG